MPELPRALRAKMGGQLHCGEFSVWQLRLNIPQKSDPSGESNNPRVTRLSQDWTSVKPRRKALRDTEREKNTIKMSRESMPRSTCCVSKHRTYGNTSAGLCSLTWAAAKAAFWLRAKVYIQTESWEQVFTIPRLRGRQNWDEQTPKTETPLQNERKSEGKAFPNRPCWCKGVKQFPTLLLWCRTKVQWLDATGQLLAGKECTGNNEKALC